MDGIKLQGAKELDGFIEGKIQEHGVRGLFAGKNLGSGAPSQDARIRTRPPQSSSVGLAAPQASGVGGGQKRTERVGERRPRPESVAEVPRKRRGGQAEGILRDRDQLEAQRLSFV